MKKTKQSVTSQVSQLERENSEMKKALSLLVDLYVSNRGTRNVFITCRTPKSGSNFTKAEREQSETWVAWDWARRLIGDKLEKWPLR